MHVRYFREVWEWGHCSSVRWCMCLAEGPMSIFNNVQNFPSPFSSPSLICLGPHPSWLPPHLTGCSSVHWPGSIYWRWHWEHRAWSLQKWMSFLSHTKEHENQETSERVSELKLNDYTLVLCLERWFSRLPVILSPSRCVCVFSQGRENRYCPSLWDKTRKGYAWSIWHHWGEWNRKRASSLFTKRVLLKSTRR